MTVSFKVRIGAPKMEATFAPIRSLPNRCGGLDHLGYAAVPSARRTIHVPALVRVRGTGAIQVFLPDETNWPRLVDLDLNRTRDACLLADVPLFLRSPGACGETVHVPAAFLKGTKTHA